MLPDNTIKSFAEWVKATLTAHAADMEEEARSNEKGKAKASFSLEIKNIAGDKWQAKCKSTFPKAAETEDSAFDFQLQLQLPGM